MKQQQSESPGTGSLGEVYAESGGRAAMKQRFVPLVIIGVMAISGCTPASHNGSSASPPTSAAAECERNGGVWRAVLNFCEYQAPESPPTPPRSPR
jgi:hypothetical protein